jgi:colicin import membrane protein
MAVPLLIPLAAAGAQIAGSIFSFSQAKKARDREKKAQAAAAKAMAQARQEMSVNYMKGLSIAKEPYELEREAIAQAGASALQAGVEGDPRGAAATAGRVMQAQQNALAQQRAAMAQEMSQLERLAATEESRLGRARASIDLGEAAGAQKAAQDAALMSMYNTQQGIQQGIKGVTGVLTSGLFDGKGGDTGGIIPGEGMIGGQAPGLGVDVSLPTGFNLLDGVTSLAPEPPIDYSSMFRRQLATS